MLRNSLYRALHSQLQSTAAIQHKPIQFRSALDVVLDILHDPKHHIEHTKRWAELQYFTQIFLTKIARFAASVIMTMTYGKTTPTYYSDPDVVEVNVCTTRLGKVVPAGQHIVDKYPLLRFVPFVVSTLRQWHKDELGLFSRMVDEVRTQLVSTPRITLESWFVDVVV